MPIYPKWVIEAEDKYDPYIKDGKLSDDAPEWAKELYRKVDNWYHEVTDGVM